MDYIQTIEPLHIVEETQPVAPNVSELTPVLHLNELTLARTQFHETHALEIVLSCSLRVNDKEVGGLQMKGIYTIEGLYPSNVEELLINLIMYIYTVFHYTVNNFCIKFGFKPPIPFPTVENEYFTGLKNEVIKRIRETIESDVN